MSRLNRSQSKNDKKRKPKVNEVDEVNDKFEDLVFETIDALGGPASKEVILRTLGTATNRQPITLVNGVDQVIDNLMDKGILEKEEGKYSIVSSDAEEMPPRSKGRFSTFDFMDE